MNFISLKRWQCPASAPLCEQDIWQTGPSVEWCRHVQRCASMTIKWEHALQRHRQSVNSSSKHFANQCCLWFVYIIGENGSSVRASIPESQYVILTFAKYVLQTYWLKTFFRFWPDLESHVKLLRLVENSTRVYECATASDREWNCFPNFAWV